MEVNQQTEQGKRENTVVEREIKMKNDRNDVWSSRPAASPTPSVKIMLLSSFNMYFDSIAFFLSYHKLVSLGVSADPAIWQNMILCVNWNKTLAGSDHFTWSNEGAYK